MTIRTKTYTFTLDIADAENFESLLQERIAYSKLKVCESIAKKDLLAITAVYRQEVLYLEQLIKTIVSKIEDGINEHNC